MLADMGRETVYPPWELPQIEQEAAMVSRLADHWSPIYTVSISELILDARSHSGINTANFCGAYKKSTKISNFGVFNKANLTDLITATGLVIKCSNRIRIIDFSACVTLKFDGWPRKTIGHLFYTMSSFVHHFKSIGEFKLDLQSGYAQFGSKSVIFFVPCDLKIWWMALKNNRAPLLCCFKLCASFHSHQWIKTWVVVRKMPNLGRNQRFF